MFAIRNGEESLTEPKSDSLELDFASVNVFEHVLILNFGPDVEIYE